MSCNTATCFEIGDVFTAPRGCDDPAGRFPGREMRVITTWEVFPDVVWIDAVPVEYKHSDEFVHSTYVVGDDGEVVPSWLGTYLLHEAAKKFDERVEKQLNERVTS